MFSAGQTSQLQQQIRALVPPDVSNTSIPLPAEGGDAVPPGVVSMCENATMLLLTPFLQYLPEPLCDLLSALTRGTL